MTDAASDALPEACKRCTPPPECPYKARLMATSRRRPRKRGHVDTPKKSRAF